MDAIKLDLPGFQWLDHGMEAWKKVDEGTVTVLVDENDKVFTIKVAMGSLPHKTFVTIMMDMGIYTPMMDNASISVTKYVLEDSNIKEYEGFISCEEQISFVQLQIKSNVIYI